MMTQFRKSIAITFIEKICIEMVVTLARANTKSNKYEIADSIRSPFPARVDSD